MSFCLRSEALGLGLFLIFYYQRSEGGGRRRGDGGGGGDNLLFVIFTYLEIVVDVLPFV